MLAEDRRSAGAATPLSISSRARSTSPSPSTTGKAVTKSGLIIEAFEVVEKEGNLLTIGGASVQWQTLIGNGTTTAGQAAHLLQQRQRRISSVTRPRPRPTRRPTYRLLTSPYRASAWTQLTRCTRTRRELQAVSRSPSALPSARPWRTSHGRSGPSSTVPVLAPSGRRMLNRKVESLGTKTSAATWVLTITLSLA
jgi:hypothetical protein